MHCSLRLPHTRPSDTLTNSHYASFVTVTPSRFEHLIVRLQPDRTAPFFQSLHPVSSFLTSFFVFTSGLAAMHPLPSPPSCRHTIPSHRRSRVQCGFSRVSKKTLATFSFSHPVLSQRLSCIHPIFGSCIPISTSLAVVLVLVVLTNLFAG